MCFQRSRIAFQAKGHRGNKGSHNLCSRMPVPNRSGVSESIWFSLFILTSFLRRFAFLYHVGYSSLSGQRPETRPLSGTLVFEMFSQLTSESNLPTLCQKHVDNARLHASFTIHNQPCTVN